MSVGPLYSKRDALALEGKIDAVWGFPDPLSVLSPDCLYNCLTGALLLCRTICNMMRTADIRMFKMLGLRRACSLVAPCL